MINKLFEAISSDELSYKSRENFNTRDLEAIGKILSKLIFIFGSYAIYYNSFRTRLYPECSNNRYIARIERGSSPDIIIEFLKIEDSYYIIKFGVDMMTRYRYAASDKAVETRHLVRCDDIDGLFDFCRECLLDIRFIEEKLIKI